MVRSTTIIAVHRAGEVAIAGDGQVTLGNQTVIKRTAHKVRRLYRDRVVVGFAGVAADALTLCDKLEGHLESTRGNLFRAAVTLAREWRTDRVLRNLDAVLIAADSSALLMISGTGEVLEPDDGVLAAGSGGPLAMAAARALLLHTDLSAGEIVRAAMGIAADICVFTNHELVVERLEAGDRS